MSDITRHSTQSADGTRIGYFRRGEGPALVVTHGSVATSDQWIPVSEPLAKHFTLFVYDRRGRGMSGDNPHYDIATEMDDIAAMLAVAGPGANLLGHSYGALCTLAYAEHRGLEGVLIPFEPPLAVDGPVAGEGLATYRDLINAGDLDAAFEFALINFVRVPPQIIPLVRQSPLWGSAQPLTPTWVRELEQIEALGADLGHYARITAPTHILAGAATTPFLYQSAHDLSKVIPGAKITDLPGGDHFAHLANSAGFAEAVRAAI